MKRRVSQKDIAQALDISPITVQRAFSNKGYVSNVLKERIFTYARETGYTPSRTAKALVSKEVRRIGLCSPDKPEYFWKDVERGAMEALRHIAEFNYSVTYHAIPPGDNQAYLDKITELYELKYKVVALVCQSNFDMARIIAYIEALKMPYVFFNDRETVFNEMCFVGPDYDKGGALAANFLASACRSTGRTAIIHHVDHLNTPVYNLAVARERGFREYLMHRRPSLTYSVHVLPTAEGPRSMLKDLRNLLEANAESLDGLYYASPEHAVLAEALANLGLKDELRVVTHDFDEDMESYLEAGYYDAVVYQNPFLQGYNTVLLCSEFIENGKEPERKWFEVEHSLIMDANKHLYRNNHLFS